MNRRTFLTHLGAAAVTAPLIPQTRARAASQPAPGATTAAARPFISRLQPAVVGGGFELPDHWVWCSPRYLATWARKRIGLGWVLDSQVAWLPQWPAGSELPKNCLSLSK